MNMISPRAGKVIDDLLLFDCIFREPIEPVELIIKQRSLFYIMITISA